jgi:hypothetical protein
LTCLGASVLPDIMRVLGQLTLSCCRFHSSDEIWICLVLCSLCFTPCLCSMLFVVSSWVPLFGSGSYYSVMILRSSTDRGSNKAFAQVCPGLGICVSPVIDEPETGVPTLCLWQLGRTGKGLTLSLRLKPQPIATSTGQSRQRNLRPVSQPIASGNWAGLARDGYTQT